MGVISIIQAVDGSTAVNSASLNTNFNTIANVINGNLDSNNIASGGVTTTAIGAGAVTSSKVLYDGSKVYNSVVQSIPDSTATALTFDTESWDSGTYHSTSSNTSRMNVQTLGYHKVTCHISFASWDTTTARRLYVQFRKNGATTYTLTDFTLTSSGPSWAGSLDIFLLANDYIEVIVFQNTTVARNISAGENVTSFTMQRLGG